jgi:8-amino-7-oxononanoate synthase
MLISHLNHQLLERDALALTRQRRIAESASAPHQRLTHGAHPARDQLTFCSNDYLGLANHPALIDAIGEGARLYGAGSGASHLINGHSRAHVLLEDTLAEYLSPCIPQARALSFCTGYMANMALLTSLGHAGTTLFSDQLNHASLIDGARLAKATVQLYAHRDVAGLAHQLADCDTPIKLIVTDAVFSMDGDLADLGELLILAERFDAWLIVDDAHGFGVLGAQGRGSLSHFGLCSERLIYMGTLGKAAGLSGAFVAAHPSIIEWLIQNARPYIYTTAAPPAIAHALLTSLTLIQGDEGEQRRQHLQALIEQLRQQLQALVERHPALGWTLTDSHTAIQGLVVGENATALALSSLLDAQGLTVPAIRPPTVPLGTARLRITLSAAHTLADMAQLMNALTDIAQTLESTPS